VAQVCEPASDGAGDGVPTPIAIPFELSALLAAHVAALAVISIWPLDAIWKGFTSVIKNEVGVSVVAVKPVIDTKPEAGTAEIISN
jgi:hypothetical protein